jgi:hypothetical protein
MTYCEWADDLPMPPPSRGSVGGRSYATKDELLQQATLDGRPLIDILTHYEEEYGTDKNPRPPNRLTYDRLKKVPERYGIGRIEIQIANAKCVRRPDYKVTPHNYYDDPFWIEIEWEYHDEQGNRLYSLTVSKHYEADIFKLEDLHADEFWNLLGHMTIFDKTFEEHCNSQENNNLVQIFIGA